MAFENEKIIETKSCKHCNASFSISDKDLEFYNKLAVNIAENIFPIPLPSLCPECRSQRRLTFRNERKFYKRPCDATQRDIISIYSPDKIQKVYHYSSWWSDTFDAREYGRQFDFSRPFFIQIQELFDVVPKMNLQMNDDSENCEYINFEGASKNGYMLTG